MYANIKLENVEIKEGLEFDIKAIVYDENEELSISIDKLEVYRIGEEEYKPVSEEELKMWEEEIEKDPYHYLYEFWSSFYWEED